MPLYNAEYGLSNRSDTLIPSKLHLPSSLGFYNYCHFFNQPFLE